MTPWQCFSEKSNIPDLIPGYLYLLMIGGVFSLFSESKRGCVLGEEWSRGSKSQSREKLSTTLHLVHAHQHPGPEPPVEDFLREHHEEKEKKDKGEDKSFFQKYWQYLLIGFIVYTLMGVLVKAPEAEGSGEGQ